MAGYKGVEGSVKEGEEGEEEGEDSEEEEVVEGENIQQWWQRGQQEGSAERWGGRGKEGG